MPKTREQNQAIKDERRTDIIMTSVYLFAFHGYGATSIDQITEKAKCSHGLFYHYFRNKEDLFSQMMDYILNNAFSSIYEINIDNQKASYALHDLLLGICNIFKNRDDNEVCMLFFLMNLFLEKNTLPKPPKKEIKDTIKKPLFIIFKELIERGQTEGDFQIGDSREYTIALISMIKGLAYNRLFIGYKQFTCPSAEIMMKLVNK